MKLPFACLLIALIGIGIWKLWPDPLSQPGTNFGLTGDPVGEPGIPRDPSQGKPLKGTESRVPKTDPLEHAHELGARPPLAKTRELAAGTFLATILIEWSDGSPAPSGELFLITGEQEEEHPVLFEHGKGSVVLPEGRYDVDTVMFNDWAQAFDESADFHVSPNQPECVVTLTPERLENPDYPVLHVLDAITARPLPEVFVCQEGVALQGDWQRSRLASVGLGPRNFEDPWRFGASPLVIPPTDGLTNSGGQALWVGAKGYAWEYIGHPGRNQGRRQSSSSPRRNRPLPHQSTVMLNRAGDVSIQWSNFDFKIKEATLELEIEHGKTAMEFELGDRNVFRNVRAGQGRIKVFLTSKLRTGLVLFEQDIRIQAGKTTHLHIDRKTLKGYQAPASVHVRVLVGPNTYNIPSSLIWLPADPSFQERSPYVRLQSIRVSDSGPYKSSTYAPDGSYEGTFHGLAPGTYRVGLLNGGQVQTVQLLPGEVTFVEFDFRDRIAITLSVDLVETEAEKGLNVPFKWAYADDWDNLPKEAFSTERLIVGQPIELEVFARPIRIRHVHTNWFFPSPDILVSPSGPRAFTVLAKRNTLHPHKLQFERDGEPIVFTDKLLESFTINAVGHAGRYLKPHASVLLLSSSLPKPIWTAHFSVPGKYTIVSNDGAFLPQTFAVGLQPGLTVIPIQ